LVRPASRPLQEARPANQTWRRRYLRESKGIHQSSRPALSLFPVVPTAVRPEEGAQWAMTAVACRNLRMSTSSVRAPGQRPGLKVVQPMSAEIALAMIVLFFSGVWSAIKYVDDYTDNRLVFFVPAAGLTLFLLTGIGEGFVFFACLFALGPIIVMLIIVGLDQGSQNSILSSRASGSSKSNSRKKDLNRKLAPSYKRAYDRLIGYVQARGGEIKSREDGILRLNELGSSDAERFFSSPYVIKALDLPLESTPSSPSHVSEGSTSSGADRRAPGSFTEIEGDDWWEKGYGDGTEKTTQKTSSPGESCGDSRCSNPVSAFDFRCFTCRRRFCSEHAGANIECSDCSK